MFDPNFFRANFFSNRNQGTLTTAMELACAFKVEEDLLDKWRGEEEKQREQADFESTGRRTPDKPKM